MAAARDSSLQAPGCLEGDQGVCRFGLRPTRLAATKDLHHLLGHQLVDIGA